MHLEAAAQLECSGIQPLTFREWSVCRIVCGDRQTENSANEKGRADKRWTECQDKEQRQMNNFQGIGNGELLSAKFVLCDVNVPRKS